MNPPIKVLFIEENPYDARRLREKLGVVDSRICFQLEWVDRLEKGLEYLTANHDVQAVLLGLSLSETQALNSLERVLACALPLPVIVITGEADDEAGMK